MFLLSRLFWFGTSVVSDRLMEERPKPRSISATARLCSCRRRYVLMKMALAPIKKRLPAPMPMPTIPAWDRPPEPAALMLLASYPNPKCATWQLGFGKSVGYEMAARGDFYHNLAISILSCR